MKPEVATAVLEAVKSERGIKSTGAAAHVIRTWLRALGLVQDNWGNYKLDDATRYKLSPRTLHKQKRGSGGDWYNVLNTPLIDAALNLATKAEQVLGVTGGAGASAKAARLAAQAKAADKAEEKKRKARADELASKYMAIQHRDATLRYLTAPDSFSAGELSALRDDGLAHAAMFRHNVDAGTDPKDDEMFASADIPPVLPVFRPVPYYWIEKEGGVEYSIAVRHQRNPYGSPKAIINIGRMSEIISIDPTSMTAGGLMDWEPVGDAGCVGHIQWSDGHFVAGLFMVIAKEKKSGAGARVLRLWCRMMRGYKVARWIGEGVGTEGGPFLRALERKGEIKVLSQQESMWLVECV